MNQTYRNKYKVSHPSGDGTYLQLYYKTEYEAISTKLNLCASDNMTPSCRKKKKRSSDAKDLITGVRESVRRGKKILLSKFTNHLGKSVHRDISYISHKEREKAKIEITKWRLNLVHTELNYLAKKHDIKLILPNLGSISSSIDLDKKTL